ncbi:MAG: hypothetical protein KQI35_03235 [Bacteroidetes bacterium]|nr:hypothetical protein [Bacteroidota bacterium]
MVKGTKITRLGGSLSNNFNFAPLKVKGVIITIFIITYLTSSSWAQEMDTLSMGENKAQTLKYLRSLASVEKENCEKAKFITNYEIDLTSGKEVMVTKDSWIKAEPSVEAKNCNTLIPEHSIVKIYSSVCKENFYAVKFKNKWGFIASEVIEQF